MLPPCPTWRSIGRLPAESESINFGHLQLGHGPDVIGSLYEGVNVYNFAADHGLVGFDVAIELSEAW
jgi:hypothetical protein